MTGTPGLSAAEFVAGTGGSSARFSAADQLAGYAGSRSGYMASLETDLGFWSALSVPYAIARVLLAVFAPRVMT